MKINKKWIIGGVILLLAGLLYMRLKTPEDTWICQNGAWVKHGNPSFPMPARSCVSGDQATPEDAAKLPNPASQNCLDKGGKLETIQETAGTLGICRFTDGSACEEWQFFRNECAIGKTVTPDTSHPYTGKAVKKNGGYIFVTETGVEYELVVDKSNKTLNERLLKEINQNTTVVGAEDPPMSKKLLLKSFQNK